MSDRITLFFPYCSLRSPRFRDREKKSLEAYSFHLYRLLDRLIADSVHHHTNSNNSKSAADNGDCFNG